MHACVLVGEELDAANYESRKTAPVLGQVTEFVLVGFRPLSPPLIAHQKDLSYLVRFCVVIPSISSKRYWPGLNSLSFTKKKKKKKKRKATTGNLPCMNSAIAFG